jgi:hypothetical protein
MDDAAHYEDIITEEDIRISMHALPSVAPSDTLRLSVKINGVELTALVDSGSTHTFIHDEVARRVGLDITHRPDLMVTVAKGTRLRSSGICSSTTVGIHGEQFAIDCYALALDGFDVVLGVQWLKTLGPITWEFEALSMSYWYKGRALLWHGIGGSSVSLATLTATRDLMDALLQDYADIFAEPHGLLPARRHDHHIHLLPGTAPIAVSPCHYPQLLKDEIERICDEMLAQGIIRESTLPFSFSVLQVKKQDETWRFCVDFRALNDKMVKNKFPFPSLMSCCTS